MLLTNDNPPSTLLPIDKGKIMYSDDSPLKELVTQSFDVLFTVSPVMLFGRTVELLVIEGRVTFL